MRSKRMLGLAVSCGLLIGGLMFATPSAISAVHADGPTPTSTPANTNGNGGGGHT